MQILCIFMIMFSFSVVSCSKKDGSSDPERSESKITNDNKQLEQELAELKWELELIKRSRDEILSLLTQEQDSSESQKQELKDELAQLEEMTTQLQETLSQITLSQSQEILSEEIEEDPPVIQDTSVSEEDADALDPRKQMSDQEAMALRENPIVTDHDEHDPRRQMSDQEAMALRKDTSTSLDDSMTTPAVTSTSHTKIEEYEGIIPLDYFNGGAEDAKEVFTNLYQKFVNHPKLANSRTALEKTLAFFARNRNSIPKSCGGDLSRNNRRGQVNAITKIDNQKYVLIVDYTIPHPQDRFFVLNLESGEVQSSPSSHGYGSNRPISQCPRDQRINCGSRGTKCRIPVDMGNTGGSGDTSRGYFLTDTGYRSSQETFILGDPPSLSPAYNALQLRGLQKGINDNALSRDIVLHRASYVQNACLSSAGCPTMTPTLFENIKGDVVRALIYIHTIRNKDIFRPGC